MNLKKYRSSFLCSFIGRKELVGDLQSFVANRRYQTLHYLSAEALIQDTEDHPPHFVCWYMEHFNESTLRTWADRFLEELPETRLILIIKGVQPQFVLGFNLKNVYSVLSVGGVSSSHVLNQIDHAAENLVYLYLNEQLTERLKELEEKNLEVTNETEPIEALESFEEPLLDESQKLDAGKYFDLQRSLLGHTDVNGALECFLSHIEPVLTGDSGALYFKFNSPRKTLIAAYGLGVDPALIEGIGLNLEKVDPEFRRSDIHEMHNRESFKSLLRDVFRLESFHCHYLNIQSEVIGILISWGLDKNSRSYEFVNSGFDLLRSHCRGLDLSKKLHVADASDESRYALKKNLFFQKMNEEVARARRTSMPLAFVLMSVDKFKELENNSDPLDLNLFFRTVAQIVDKHSRVNDILGRISRSEFGLLLPHTSVRGGVVKAERLRRMIESANFGKVLGYEQPTTISLSVSEYPSHCRDADELFQSADQALFDQDRFVANKVVVTRPPEGFIADFIVQEIRDSRLVR